MASPQAPPQSLVSPSAPLPGAFSMPPSGMPQPGIPMLPHGGWLPPSTTCPRGLEYLMALDHLYLYQKFQTTEAATKWERKHKYTAMSIRGETIFYVLEKSNIFARLCMGSYRSCEFRVYDVTQREILRMVRPFRCNSCCCPCYLQELKIYSQDTLLGSVSQTWNLCQPSFSIRNDSGETVLLIKGPWIRCHTDVTFKVQSADGEHRIGDIKNQWVGVGGKYYTEADNFVVSFPLDLDVKMKAVLLGACLLIDFMYF